MDYDEIFEAYYSQYRAEAQVPVSSDDEYIIGLPLANEAINRWSNYDNTMWKELFTTAQIESDGTLTLEEGTTDYTAPENMRLAGGSVRVFTDEGTVAIIPIIEPQDAQFRTDGSSYAYFIGDPNNGFTLKLNPAPNADLDGKSIDYVYYKKPTTFTNGGGEVVEMSQPYFIVHRMLANRFRASRNPYYGSAKTDAEDVLRTMQMENNSGSWANPWQLQDNTGSGWGV